MHRGINPKALVFGEDGKIENMKLTNFDSVLKDVNSEETETRTTAV